MRHLFAIFVALLLCATAQAQTVKALAYNTTNGHIIYSGTNALTFVNTLVFDDDVSGNAFESSSGSNSVRFDSAGVTFAGSAAATTRTNLGLGATWLTNTNVTNFRTAIGLGETNAVTFGNLTLANGGLALGDTTTNSVLIVIGNSGFSIEGDLSGQPLFEFVGTNLAAQARKDFGLGSSNIVTFAGLTNNGDIRINQTATTNGLLFVYRTNNEPFLGLANLIASNNTTVSNETLFRVGVAEATNKSAQFGFRATNTNGNGVAVFSVFGFNALMQIGADASTNAVIYSGGGTNNEVMTLIRDGATEFARPLRFSTNSASKPSTNAPANTTNVAAWVEMQIGTNSYRLPLYQ